MVNYTINCLQYSRKKVFLPTLLSVNWPLFIVAYRTLFLGAKIGLSPCQKRTDGRRQERGAREEESETFGVRPPAYLPLPASTTTAHTTTRCLDGRNTSRKKEKTRMDGPTVGRSRLISSPENETCSPFPACQRRRETRATSAVLLVGACHIGWRERRRDRREPGSE